MRRMLALALCILLLAGCAQETPQQPPETTPSTTQGDTQPTTQPTVPTTQPAPLEPTLPEPEENPYYPSDFVYEDGFLTCTAGETLVGIDVSVHQGLIDWQQVADAGVDFAMIRAGYRGYKYGQVNEDTSAHMNIQLAQAAGLMVGVYFYSQAVSVEEAVEEANFLVEFLEGYTLELPVVFDWERYSDEARTANVSGRTVTDCAIAFCDVIRDSGREPMIYFNSNQALNQLSMPELTEYGFWLAQYDTSVWFPYKVDMWQYSNKGRVPGVNTNVDLNIGFFPKDAV